MKLARTFALAALGGAMALAAQAATPTQTVLNFPLLHLPLLDGSSLSYSNTVGGTVNITPGSGQLAYAALGYLGVTSGGLLSQLLDPALGKGESITFKFDKAVTLTGWDVDDFNPLIIIPDGTNKFGLSVDGGAAQTFAFGNHSAATALVGKSFTFSYAGDNYFIDKLVFGTASAVPEATTLAQLALGLGMMGWLMKRRRQAAD